MVALPQETTEEKVAQRIYKSIEKADGNELWLTRIGASGVGEECMRALWYSWRGYTHKQFDGRMLRLFETGHLQEERIQSDLMRAGYQVWALDDKGRQFTYVDPTGHAVCKIDGVIKGVEGREDEPGLLEIKTHSDKSFNEVKKKGVARAKPLHLAQMHMGMWLTGLEFALYVALNKNNEEYYMELIGRDERAQSHIERKIVKLVEADIIPVGVSDKQDEYFGCRFCDHREVCTGRAEPVRHCRSCVAATPAENGEWVCVKNGVLLNREDQLIGCKEYEVKI